MLDVNVTTVVVEKSQNAISTSAVTPNQVVSENLEVSKNTNTADKPAGSDGTIAIILAIVSVVFLPFGLHNWYLGRRKQALWQTLLVFPFGILIH